MGHVVVPRGTHGCSVPQPALADTMVSDRDVNQRPNQLTDDDLQAATLDLYLL
jgi:hypothetical protein